MELVRSSRWYGAEPRPTMSIEAAIVDLCKGSHDFDGQYLASVAKETGELIGRLVEKLHEKGILDEDAVLEIIGWRFRKRKLEES